MASKSVSFTTAGNHWRWVGNYYEEVQVGQLVTMPETGKVTSIRIQVAGLGPYYDPVYHNQQDPTKVAAAVWDASTGKKITESAVVQLGPEDGGTASWKVFNVPDTWIEAGRDLIVGFWRIKTTTAWATQWDYNDAGAASGETYVQMNSGANYNDGPVKFVISERTRGKSINYELNYQTGGQLKVWDGTTWKPGSAKVWDGSAWVEGVVKYYDGSDWIESNT